MTDRTPSTKGGRKNKLCFNASDSVGSSKITEKNVKNQLEGFGFRCLSGLRVAFGVYALSCR